jgi:hypothetical protein
MTEKAEKIKCNFPECNSTKIDSNFAVHCEKCGNWFHGDCVAFPKEMVKLVDQQSKLWICDPCTKLRTTHNMLKMMSPKLVQVSQSSQKCRQIARKKTTDCVLAEFQLEHIRGTRKVRLKPMNPKIPFVWKRSRKSTKKSKRENNR